MKKFVFLKVMYDMSKDLHQLRMEHAIGGTKTDKKPPITKDDIERKIIQDVADLKSQNFLLQTKLKEADRRLQRSPEKDDIVIQDVFQKKLMEKEEEVRICLTQNWIDFFSNDKGLIFLIHKTDSSVQGAIYARWIKGQS